MQKSIRALTAGEKADARASLLKFLVTRITIDNKRIPLVVCTFLFANLAIITRWYCDALAELVPFDSTTLNTRETQTSFLDYGQSLYVIYNLKLRVGQTSNAFEHLVRYIGFAGNQTGLDAPARTEAVCTAQSATDKELGGDRSGDTPEGEELHHTPVTTLFSVLSKVKFLTFRGITTPVTTSFLVSRTLTAVRTASVLAGTSSPV
jgi:hypothetical protein